MTDIPAGALVVCWPELFGVGLVAPKRRAVAVPGRPDSAVVARDVAPLAMASALLWLRDRGLLTLALDSARGFRRPAVRVSATAPVRLDERPPQRPLPHEGPEPMAYVSVRPNQKARDVVSNWIRSSDRTGDDGALFVILRGAASCGLVTVVDAQRGWFARQDRGRFDIVPNADAIAATHGSAEAWSRRLRDLRGQEPTLMDALTSACRWGINATVPSDGGG